MFGVPFKAYKTETVPESQDECDPFSKFSI
jgi:hypothetical protein